MKFQKLKGLGKLAVFMSMIVMFFHGETAHSQSTTNTYYVAKSGSDGNPGTSSQPFLSIKQCVRILVAGDTCLVRGGTYNEHFINIGAGSTASGTSWSNPITLKAYPGEPVVVTNIAEDSIMYFGGGNLFWIIDGFIFEGSSGWRCCDTAGGLINGGGSYVRIQNSEIRYGVSNGVLAAGAYWELLNLNVHHNGTQRGRVNFHGVYWFGTNLVIDGGAYHDNAGYGIHIFNSLSSSVSDNTVRNTRVFANNTQGGNGGVILSSGSNNSAYNNLIYNNAEDGLDIDYRCNGCSAYNNTIYNNSRWGMQLGANVLVMNTTVKNNIVYGNLNAIRDKGSFTNASNNMTSNPLFANVSEGDFSLQPASGAIAAGENLSSIFTTDILNNLRSTTRPFDLGAYAFNSTAATPFKAAFMGAPGQDYVGQGGQYTGNGKPDWNIHFQGMRSTPIRVRVTSNAGGVWEDPYNGSSWAVLTQADRTGSGDLWFEPWSTPGFHVKVWYPDGTTDEADAVDQTTQVSKLAAQFIGVTGEDFVGPGNQTTGNGVTDWHIRVQGVRSSPVMVRITSAPGGIWETPFNGSNWIISTRLDGSGNMDLWFEPWRTAGFHLKVWYSDGSADEVDVVDQAAIRVPFQALFVGVTGEDIVGPGQTSPNGTPDWHIRVLGLRSNPVRAQITSLPGGLWETPFNGSNWVIALRPDGAGNADAWYEPWNVPYLFHIKVWYADGSTDESDAR